MLEEFLWIWWTGKSQWDFHRDENNLHIRQCTKCKQFTLTDTRCLFCGEKRHTMLTREEALDTMGATLDDWIDKKNIHMLIDQIFYEHEAQMKAKDEEIERLKVKLKRDLNEPLKSITINQMGGGKDEY